jgi:NAD(P)-dependent dehydrogenase (short-subunit alcohol dehydrogenase family)
VRLTRRCEGMDQTENGNRRVAMVTGASGAIGKAIARGIAKDPGYEVILLCRNEAKGRHACQEIKGATGNSRVRHEVADVSRWASVKELAKRWQGPLHVLVNNAALTPQKREETPEGIELQFATNVLGYFWMIQAFSEALRRSAPARVVNVASHWAGDLDLTDLEFRRRRYTNGEAYRQSKQANRMLTVAFAERLKPHGISVNVCHPGNVNSALSNNLGFAGSQAPAEGARTPIWLAVSPIGQQMTGKFFEYMREVRCSFGEDRKAVEELYQACLRFSGGRVEEGARLLG